MASRSFKFTQPSGFRFNRRSIGFMESEGASDLDAREVFDALDGNTRRIVNTRIDYWLQGSVGSVYKKYFHGWPDKPEYKLCFVFKWDEKRNHHRLYGFLCNPKPKTDRSFRLCVLVLHAVKNDWETDLTELDRVNAVRQSPDASKAIARIYPEYRGEYTWLQ